MTVEKDTVIVGGFQGKQAVYFQRETWGRQWNTRFISFAFCVPALLPNALNGPNRPRWQKRGQVKHPAKTPQVRLEVRLTYGILSF